MARYFEVQNGEVGSVKIYFAVPVMTCGGGVYVLGYLSHMLSQQGYESAVVITEEGSSGENPSWSFPYTVVKPEDVVDLADNIYVASGGLDLIAAFLKYKNIQLVYFAQDSAQDNTYFGKQLLCVLQSSRVKLITLGHHTFCYWLYRYGKQSKTVNGFVDLDLFKIPEKKVANLAMMLNYRNDVQTILPPKQGVFYGYIDPVVTKAIEESDCGLQLRFVEGSKEQVAAAFGAAEYFISCCNGVPNGLTVTEGWGMPVFEAMACGCIVFVKDTHGVRSFLADGLNGYLYETADEIIEKVKFLNKNPEHKDYIARNAMYTARVLFNKERTCAEFKQALGLENNLEDGR